MSGINIVRNLQILYFSNKNKEIKNLKDGEKLVDRYRHLYILLTNYVCLHFSPRLLLKHFSSLTWRHRKNCKTCKTIRVFKMNTVEAMQFELSEDENISSNYMSFPIGSLVFWRYSLRKWQRWWWRKITIDIWEVRCLYSIICRR